ncbi:c-type cytochrome [Tropicimonas sp. S265A]|uniref:c-type cytochrome n=1 Tax=Tropicimonas sp. S265A TaxID=3415134 RepID=UPI003C7CAD43
MTMRAIFAAVLIALPGGTSAGDFFTLKGHGGPIMSVSVAPSGQIATASFDNSVGLWNDGAPKWLEGHEAAVKSVLFLDDTALVSAGDDFALWLWDARTGQGRELGRHKGQVIGLAASPGGDLVATASWDGTIGLWPLDGGSARFLEGHDAGVNDVVFVEGGAALLSASSDGTIRRWEISDAPTSRVILKHGFGVNRLIADEDAGWLAYGSVDGVTRIVDLDTQTEVIDLTLGRRPILALARAPRGDLLATGDGEGYITVFNTADWSVATDFRATTRGPIWALAFSLDGGNIHAGGLDEAMYSWPSDRASDSPQMDVEGKPFLQGTQTASNGERQFKRKCAICHTLTPDGQRRAGPSLHAVFGRPAGAVPGYAYSDALTDTDIIWDDTTIDKLFDLGPDIYTPGSKMPMQRITEPQDRRDLIAYLRVQTDPEGGEQ